MAVRRKPAALPPHEGTRRWSAERVQRFFDTLARTANVLASERAAGLGERSAYTRRQRDPEFRAAWDVALREGYANLEITALERAMHGQRKPLLYGGKIVTEVTEYSDRLVLTLLAAHRASAKGIPANAGDDAEAIRERIRAKMDAERGRSGDA